MVLWLPLLLPSVLQWQNTLFACFSMEVSLGIHKSFSSLCQKKEGFSAACVHPPPKNRLGASRMGRRKETREGRERMPCFSLTELGKPGGSPLLPLVLGQGQLFVPKGEAGVPWVAGMLSLAERSQGSCSGWNTLSPFTGASAEQTVSASDCRARPCLDTVLADSAETTPAS